MSMNEFIYNILSTIEHKSLNFEDNNSPASIDVPFMPSGKCSGQIYIITSAVSSVGIYCAAEVFICAGLNGNRPSQPLLAYYWAKDIDQFKKKLEPLFIDST